MFFTVFVVSVSYDRSCFNSCCKILCGSCFCFNSYCYLSSQSYVYVVVANVCCLNNLYFYTVYGKRSFLSKESDTLRSYRVYVSPTMYASSTLIQIESPSRTLHVCVGVLDILKIVFTDINFSSGASLMRQAEIDKNL